MKRILAVDDEDGIRTVLHGVLTSAGYQVDTAVSGEDALNRFEPFVYDLILVDLQMTGIGGLELIKQARAAAPQVATIILTGFATVDTAVAALHEGVDDYLVKPTKPQAIREAVQRALSRRQHKLQKEAVLARIATDMQTLLENSQPVVSDETAVWQKGPLTLNEAAHQACWHGRFLNLTPTEFKLLTHLAHRAGKVQSPQELVTAVQGYACTTREARELIKPHLYRLRATLEPDPAHPIYLVNIRGVGYMLQLPQYP